MGHEKPKTDAQLARQSDRFLASVRELKDLEDRKRASARSTDEFHTLAEQVEHKARSIYHQSVDQRESGEDDSPDRRERDEQYPGDWVKNAEH